MAMLNPNGLGGGVSPLVARLKRRPVDAAAGTGLNQPVLKLPDAPGDGAIPLNDAPTWTPNNPGAIPIGDGGITPRMPPGAPGSSSLTPQAPTPTPNPMPPTGGFPMGGGAPSYASSYAFGPGNDLRGQTIAPSDSPTTTAANSAVTNAMGNYTGWQAQPWQSIGAGSYNPAADTTGLRASLTQALGALQSAPDRGQLAAQNFALLDQTAREASNRDIRTIGQGASKFGRIGSGITTTNLGDLGERQAIDRSRAQAGMSLDAAGQALADRLGVAGAIQSGFGALSGADVTNAGVQQGLRNEARGERTASNDYNTADFNRRGQLFGDMANYAQLQTSNDAARRGELRGERAYQGGQEQTAYDRNRQAINDALGQTGVNLGQAESVFGAGQGYDPSGFIAQAGANQSAQGAAGSDYIYRLLAGYYGKPQPQAA